MTDERLFALLEALRGAPSLVLGDHQFYHLPGAVVLFTRVGRGERWSFAPSRDVYRLEALPSWWPRAVREWARRAEVFDVAAHARAMARRVL